jgi:hypothetical protein
VSNRQVSVRCNSESEQFDWTKVGISVLTCFLQQAALKTAGLISHLWFRERNVTTAYQTVCSSN